MKKCSAFPEHLETTRGNSVETRNIRLAGIAHSSAFCSTVNQPQSNRAGQSGRMKSAKTRGTGREPLTQACDAGCPISFY